MQGDMYLRLLDKEDTINMIYLYRKSEVMKKMLLWASVE
jgi:hypothetical protein